MSIDKALYEMPTNPDDAGNPTAVDLTAANDNPLIVELEDGSVDVTLSPEEEMPESFDANLAETLEEGLLNTLATEQMELVEADISSRKEWADTFVRGLEVLGFKYEMRTDPWEDACGVYSTLLAEAAIRFQAETMSETFPAAGPVKTKILGEVTRDKEDAADRVQADMNYELTDVMTEYRPEHERMLYGLGLAGSAFKKIYYDDAMGRQVAIFLPAEEVIVPYGASHIETAERVTHVMRKTKNDFTKAKAAGLYVDVDLGEPQSFQTDIEERKAKESGITITDDNRYTFYEMHVELVIDGTPEGEDEIAKPYILTVDKCTGKVLALYRNWKEGDELFKKKQYFVHYVYVPGFGFYGLGLIHIIGGYAMAGTSIIRQLVDAGTLSNLPGGLKTRGLRIAGDDTPISPGEFRDVDVGSGKIADNVMALPYKEPSQTLLALLDRITTEGRRLGAISDMNISDMSAQAPVGTTLAILERTLKPMAAVQARVHYAMKTEFKLLKALIAEYAPQEYSYTPDRAVQQARKADYAMVEVIPVSDPNSTTMAQRVVQYQAALQMAKDAPQIYDQPQLHRQMLEVIGIKNADKLIPMSDDAKPKDPVTENMAVLVGTPVKAFMYQDHQAHISTHTSFMQDPLIAQTIGQNPMAQQIMASLQAHIAEHLGYLYRSQMEERLGVTLPGPDEELPEDFEVQLSRLVADAGKQLTANHQQQAAQEQAQQQAQDPAMQLEIEQVAVKKADVERKAEKDKADVDLAQQRIELDRAKLEKDDQHKNANRKLDLTKTVIAASKPTPAPAGGGK